MTKDILENTVMDVKKSDTFKRNPIFWSKMSLNVNLVIGLVSTNVLELVQTSVLGAKKVTVCIQNWAVLTLTSVTGSEDGGAKSRTAVCGKNEFCVNTDGNYKCSKCDQSCSTCHGDGPDSCDECAEGYTKNPDNVCITEKAAEIDSKATDEEAQKLEKTTTTSEFSPELDSLKSEL